MAAIFNVTQHNATQEQINAGVIDLDWRTKEIVTELLTFSSIPTAQDMEDRAKKIVGAVYGDMVDFTEQYGDTEGELPELMSVMLGGAPFLMPTLERVFKEHGFQVVYAFSQRVSEESVDADGNVVKRNVFKHMGFVKA